MRKRTECPCGSGKWPEAMHDARGIFCAYVCDDCEAEKAASYRPEVMTDPNYWTDEEVEEDVW